MIFSDGSAIKIKNLSVSRGDDLIFDNFSLEIKKNVTTALIAPSGGGKTTLLFLLANITPKNCIVRRGEISACSQKVSFVFQEPRLLPSATVMENISLPLTNLMPKAEANDRARMFLEHAQLAEKSLCFPSELSGGERQRAALARAFAFPTEILLLDEPFQSQDLRTKSKMMQVLKQLLSLEKRTVVLVTHEVEEAVLLAQKIIVLDGRPLTVRTQIENDAVSKDGGEISKMTCKIKSLILE